MCYERRTCTTDNLARYTFSSPGRPRNRDPSLHVLWRRFAMPSSLSAADFQAVLDRAEQTAGRPGGPFSSPADDELRALVDATHAQGLYVIFDIVLNHTGDVFAYQCDPGDGLCNSTGGGKARFHGGPMGVRWRDANGVAQAAFTDVENVPSPSRDAFVWPKELQQNRFFRRQGVGGGSDDTVGDFDILKQILTDDTDAQRFLIRAYQYVISRFDVDAFRIDTLRYLKGNLAQTFGNSVREFALSIGKKNFFTFGEVLDGRAEEDIARFIGRNTGDQGTKSASMPRSITPSSARSGRSSRDRPRPRRSWTCTTAARRSKRTSSARMATRPGSLSRSSTTTT